MQQQIDTIWKIAATHQKRIDLYKKLLDSGKNASNITTAADMKTWLNVWKRKEDGAFPKGNDLKSFFEKAKGRDVLSIRDFLLDQGKDETLVLKVTDVNGAILDQPSNVGVSVVPEENVVPPLNGSQLNSAIVDQPGSVVLAGGNTFGN